MAALVVTNRNVGSHGHLKRETGKFTSTAWDGSEWLETKLGRLIWFRLQSIDGTADPAYVAVKNTTSGIAAKNGHVLMLSGGQNNDYIYEAMGMG